MIISWTCKWVGCGHKQTTDTEFFGPVVDHCFKCKRATRLMVAKRADGKGVAIESRPLPED